MAVQKRGYCMEEIGAQIRRFRQARGLTLQEMAERSGLSRSFLSEAERGMSSMTLTSLQRIAEALGMTLAEFFQPPSAEQVGPRIVRVAERTEFRLETTEHTIYSSLAGSFPDKLLEPVLVTLLPNQRHRVQAYSHPGEEFGMVLEGTMTLWVGDQEYDLGPGDSIHMPSTIPHNWENRTDQPVRAIWVVTPRLF